MTYNVTVENMDTIIDLIKFGVYDKSQTISIDFGTEKESQNLYINSEEYLSGRTDEYVSADDFISQLKTRYDYKTA